MFLPILKPIAAFLRVLEKLETTVLIFSNKFGIDLSE